MLELPFMHSQMNKFEDKKRLNINFIDFVQVANVWVARCNTDHLKNKKMCNSSCKLIRHLLRILFTILFTPCIIHGAHSNVRDQIFYFIIANNLRKKQNEKNGQSLGILSHYRQ